MTPGLEDPWEPQGSDGGQNGNGAFDLIFADIIWVGDPHGRIGYPGIGYNLAI